MRNFLKSVYSSNKASTWSGTGKVKILSAEEAKRINELNVRESNNEVINNVRSIINQEITNQAKTYSNEKLFWVDSLMRKASTPDNPLAVLPYNEEDTLRNLCAILEPVLDELTSAGYTVVRSHKWYGPGIFGSFTVQWG